MLRRVSIALIALAAAVAPAAAQNPNDAFQTAFQRTLPEILNDYYDAIGGEESWEEVESFKLTGKTIVGPGLETTFTLYQKRPGKLRLEQTVQGQTGVQAYDGETGWAYLPFVGQAGPIEMPEEMLTQFRQSNDVETPLVNHADKGHEVELVGEEAAQGKLCYKVQVTLASGEQQYYLLDKETGLPLAMKGTIQLRGAPAEYEATFTEYEEFAGGLMLPLRIETRVGTEPGGQTILIETVEIDVPVADELFEMPTGETPAIAGDDEDEAAE